MHAVTRAGLLFLLMLCFLGGSSVLAEQDQFAEDYRMCPSNVRLEALSGVWVRIGAMDQLIVEWDQPNPDAWHLSGDTAAITVVTDAPQSLKQDKGLDAPRAVFDDMDYTNHVWTFRVAVTDRGTVISDIVTRTFPYGDDNPGIQSHATLRSTESSTSGTQSVMASPKPTLTVSLEPAYISITEGNTATVTAKLSEKPSQPVTLPLTTTYHEGTSSDDFSGIPSEVTFDKEETSKAFTIQGIDDGIDEVGERMLLSFGAMPVSFAASQPTVTVALEDPTRYTNDSGSGSGTVAITNGDPKGISLSMTVTQPVITIVSDPDTYYILVLRGTAAKYEARWNPTDSSETHKPKRGVSGDPAYVENLATVCQKEPFLPILLTSSMSSQGNMPSFLDTVPTGSAGGTWDIYLVVEWGTAEAGLCKAADPQIPNIDITVAPFEQRLSQIEPGK